MADTKISVLTAISAPQNPVNIYFPLFAQDGTPLNARMNLDQIFKTPLQINLNANAANSAVIMSTPADGRLLLTDYAGTSFGRLQLGGTTASFPSLKRNATGVDFRLADDSDYAPITAAAIVSSTTIAATAGVSGTKFTASNTVTADSPAIDAAQTWNNAGVTFTGMKLNITDTASNVASKLLDLQVGGVSKFLVKKNGVLSNSTAVNRGSIRFNGASVEVVRFDETAYAPFGAYSLSLSVPALGSSVVEIDAADCLALRRSGNANILRVYETYTDSTTFSRGVFGFRSGDASTNSTAAGTASTGVLRIGSEKGSVGGTAAAVSIVTDGTERINIGTSGVSTFSGNLAAPAIVLAGTLGNVNHTWWSTGSLNINSSATISFNGDTVIARPAANILGITNGSTGPGTLAIDNVQGTNFERLKSEWASNVARIGTSKGGSGTARDLAFITDDNVRMTIYGGGGVNVAGGISAWSIALTGSSTPASASATGGTGQVAWDANYIYLCIATDTWRRIAHATW